MQIKHIKSVRVITEESEFWTLMDFGSDGSWATVYEVSPEFKRAFVVYMRTNLHPQDIYESGLGESDGVSQEEIEDLASFSYEGASWSVSICGTFLIRICEYEDYLEPEVPDDWWMSQIALMKAVLRSLPPA